MTLVSLQGIRKRFYLGTLEVEALRGIDMTIEEGEFVALTGPSGSGKSTLLHILGLLDLPSDGSYLLDGTDVRGIGDSELAKLRNERFGFIFQSFHLLPRATAMQNTMLPLRYARERIPRAEMTRRAEKVLARVGLGERKNHRPNELSGGQRQRVAIARALINEPRILLADEPTGNLDTRTGEEIVALLEELNRAGTTIVMVTHDSEIAARIRRRVILRDGVIVEDIRDGGR